MAKEVKGVTSKKIKNKPFFNCLHMLPGSEKLFSLQKKVSIPGRGVLRIGTEKFFRAAYLSNLFVWRKVRKLLRKAAQIIFLSSRESEHPRDAGPERVVRSYCVPVSISDRPVPVGYSHFAPTG